MPPVDHAFQLGDFRGVSDAGGGLRRLADAPAAHAVESVADELCAEHRQPVVQGLGRVARTDVEFALCQHRPGIETRRHAHDGDACLFISGQQRPLNGCGSAPSGQERGVDIDAAQPGTLQCRGGQDQAVSDDHQHIEIERAKQLQCTG